MDESFRFSKVIQFLREREKEEGGFSFVPDLYPNIEDTYYAIRTFQLLKGEVNREKTIHYLGTIDWKGVAFPRIIYMLVFLHLFLNMDLSPSLVELVEMNWRRFPALDAQYFFDKIQKLLNRPLILIQSSSHFQFQSRENLQSLRKKVSVLIDHRINFDREEIIRWIKSCQNGDGGFGFYPGTTSFMENTYCALEILSKLHAFPERIENCREYILNCQTKSGGFGRAPMSFPFIESTFQAVAGLFILDMMERGDT